MPTEVADRIIHYGNFKRSLDSLIGFFENNCAHTMIIRGNTGSGKRTLVTEAEKHCSNKIKCIFLNPYEFNDDHAALRRIARRLGFKRALTTSEIIDEIRAQSRPGDSAGTGKTPKKDNIKKIRQRIVIVLQDFEQWCSRKQSLLYILTSLVHRDTIQDGGDPKDIGGIRLIGLTLSLDPLEELEKRVRSRLNANVHEHWYPYTTINEYVEFASLLLGGFKINKSKQLRDQLEYLFNFGERSIRCLKRYLVGLLTRDQEGRLVVNTKGLGEPSEVKTTCASYILNEGHRINTILGSLTPTQLDLIKVAMRSVAEDKACKFTLSDLAKYVNNRHTCGSDKKKLIDIESELFHKNLDLLIRMAIFRPLTMKALDHGINMSTPFAFGIMPAHLKAIVEKNKDLHRVKTDLLWKGLR